LLKAFADAGVKAVKLRDGPAGDSPPILGQ
jgi:hypothetical protein